MNRVNQVILIAPFLPFCWLAMMVVHELGHLLGAYVSGGQVERVILHPLAISRTDLSGNPHPLVVCWAGPVFGIVLPLLLHAVIRQLCKEFKSISQFFAGFCMVANGAYLGIGSIHGIGDSGDLLRLGTPIWLLWIFGLCSSAAGLWLWNGLGPSFGFGSAKGKVETRIAYISLGLFTTIVLLELIFGALEETVP